MDFFTFQVKVEARGLQIQLLLEPQSEFNVSRSDLIRPCLRTSEELLSMELSGRALASHLQGSWFSPWYNYKQKRKNQLGFFLTKMMHLFPKPSHLDYVFPTFHPYVRQENTTLCSQKDKQNMVYLKSVTSSFCIHYCLWSLVSCIPGSPWGTWCLQASAPTYAGLCIRKAVPGVCTLMTPYLLLPLMQFTVTD